MDGGWWLGAIVGDEVWGVGCAVSGSRVVRKLHLVKCGTARYESTLLSTLESNSNGTADITVRVVAS